MQKRILSLLLSVFLLLPFCGCQKNGKPYIVRTVAPAAVEHVWHAEYLPFPENITASGAMTVSGDRVYLNGKQRSDDSSGKTADIVLQFSPESGTFSTELLPSPEGLPENSAVLFSIRLSDGGCAYVCDVPNDNPELEEYLLTVTDADGTTRFVSDARALFDASAQSGYFFIAGLLAGSDGTLYLFTRNAAAAASPEDGHLLWLYTADSFITEYGTTPDGRVYLTVPSQDGTETRFLDNEKKGLGDLLPTAEAFPSLHNGTLLLGAGYDFYYAQENGLFAANRTDAEPTLICDWLNSDISYDSIDPESFTVLLEGCILCITRDPVSQKRVLCEMTPVAPEDVQPKYLVHVAKTFSGSSQYLNNCTLAFNRQSEQFRVVIDDYSGTGTDLMQTPEDKLAAAVVRGEQPDMVLCSSGFDYEKFDKQGLFQNLYPFLDDRDSTIRRDDLLSCIPAAMENEKGELHLLPETFLVHTVLAKTDDLGGKTAWTLEKFLDAAEAAPADRYFWSSYGRAAFAELLRFSLDAFIDREKLTCSFDSALFGRFLTFCRDMKEPEINDLALERARTGELLLCPLTEHFESDLVQYLKYRYYAFGGAPVTPIGFPEAGSVMEPETLLGITKDSSAADGAWEFLCLYLTGDDSADSDFYHTAGRFGYPVTKAGLEKAFANARETYYVLPDPYSWHAANANGRTDEQMRAELRGQGTVAHLTAEDEADVLSMLDGISAVTHRWDDTMLSMIAEDAMLFFSGDKTLEETQRVIQGRMSIYISETLG